MPEIARNYVFKDRDTVPTIDGAEIPWWLAAPDVAMPMVQEHPSGMQFGIHILWLPILVDGPIPTYGTPDGVEIQLEDAPNDDDWLARQSAVSLAHLRALRELDPFLLSPIARDLLREADDG